ncbi:MAG: hypothetical protein ACKO1U_01085 [Bacteroidota bacterium]
MKTSFDRILLMAYVLAVIAIWPFLYPYVNNPDSFQYIGIARHLLEGRMLEGVNGYWSPLLSWMLMPFLQLTKNSIIGFKLLQTSIGAVGLMIWSRLCDKAIGQNSVSKWLKLAAIPLLICQAMLTLTADLLFTVGLLGLVLFFLHRPVWNNRRRSLQAGLFGGLLYLSKAFGLPFFLSFALFTFFHHRRTVTEATWKNLGSGLAVFVVICAGWISCISFKYGRFTISEAANYNSTTEVISKPGEVVLLPILYEDRLVAPAGEHALSAWEEPLQSAPQSELKPFRIRDDFQRWLQNTRRNFLSIWYFDFKRQAGMMFLLLLSLSFLFRLTPSWRDPIFLYPMLAVLLIYIGYGFILYHARYSWACNYLLLLVGAAMAGRSQAGSRWMRIAFAVMVLLAIKRPLKEILYSYDKDVSAYRLMYDSFHFRKTLSETYRDDFRVFRASASLDCLDGPFASRFTAENERPRYFSSLLLADRFRQRYFGQVDDRRDGSMSELKNAGVRYLVIWDSGSDVDLPGASLACSAEGMTVYRLK